MFKPVNSVSGGLVGRIRAEGGWAMVGGIVWNTLKGGGTDFWGNKDLKRGASWVKGWVP